MPSEVETIDVARYLGGFLSYVSLWDNLRRLLCRIQPAGPSGV